MVISGWHFSALGCTSSEASHRLPSKLEAKVLSWGFGLKTPLHLENPTATAKSGFDPPATSPSNVETAWVSFNHCPNVIFIFLFSILTLSFHLSQRCNPLVFIYLFIYLFFSLTLIHLFPSWRGWCYSPHYIERTHLITMIYF